MPSSSKTPLGLNIWSGLDRPKKADFNADNELNEYLHQDIRNKLKTVNAGDIAYSNPDLPGVTNVKQALDSYNEKNATIQTDLASLSEKTNSLSDEIKQLGESGANLDEAFLLQITFISGLEGKPFTVEGDGSIRTGAVPDNLIATVGVSLPNTLYTVTCEEFVSTVRTDSFFGIYPVYIGISMRYGMRIDSQDSNPATRVTYMYDAEGMRPAEMNFTTGSFDYGDWGKVWFVAKNRPVMLKNDGTVAYELNHTNHAKKLDGSASDITNTAYAGNAMSEMPTVWVKRWEEGNYRYVVVCEKQYDDTYKAYAHTDASGNVCDFIYLPMYEGAAVSGKLRSLSGQTVTGNQDDATETVQAAANGDGWLKGDYSNWELVRDLLTLMSRSTNSQSKYGNGNVAGTARLATGTMNGAGQFGGYATDSQAVKIFYCENWHGNHRKRIQGLLFINGIYRVKASAPYNNIGTGYINTGLTVTGTSGGYISKMQAVGDVGALPTVASGSETTYECDGCYFYATGTSVALVGGGLGKKDGTSCVFMDNPASATNIDFAASITFKKRISV